MADGIEAALAAYKGDKLAQTFMESAAIKMALDSQGLLPSKGHAEVDVDKHGIAHIQSKEEGQPATSFSASAEARKGTTPETTTLDGTVIQTGGPGDGYQKIDISMSPARNETVTVKDGNGKEIFQSIGAWSNDAANHAKSTFTLSKDNQPFATVEGTRTWLDGAHWTTQYTMFSTDGSRTKLGTVAIDNAQVGNKSVLDIKINGDQT
jgi:hypothetical protein